MSHIHHESDDALLREIADVEVPEPSPLFWEQFGGRVNAAIDAADHRRRWPSSAAIGWLTAAAVLCAAIATAYLTRPAALPDSPAPPPVQMQAGEIGAATESDAPDMETDEAWAVVRSFAGEVDYDDARAAGVAPHAGSVDRAATEMSDEERAELVRLIQDELRRTGA